MVKFLRLLKERHKKEASQPLSYFRTHPFTAERVLAAKEATGEKMSFEDFINVDKGESR
jgi:predicted Zn-dependent protease